jgi:hypothetical protein
MALDLKTHKIFLPLASSGLRRRLPWRIPGRAAAFYREPFGFLFLACENQSGQRMAIAGNGAKSNEGNLAFWQALNGYMGTKAT